MCRKLKKFSESPVGQTLGVIVSLGLLLIVMFVTKSYLQPAPTLRDYYPDWGRPYIEETPPGYPFPGFPDLEGEYIELDPQPDWPHPEEIDEEDDQSWYFGELRRAQQKNKNK